MMRVVGTMGMVATHTATVSRVGVFIVSPVDVIFHWPLGIRCTSCTSFASFPSFPSFPSFASTNG